MTAPPAYDSDKPLLNQDGSRRSSQDSMEFLDHTARSARRRRIFLKLAALAHPAHLTTLCKRVGYAFVPQLLRSHIWDEPAPKGKVFPTSYLNGLRGMTAIKVFTFHYLMAFTNFTHDPWGTDEHHTRWFSLPVIRYVYAGFTSQIFFACAGYLASLRIFQLLDQGNVNSQAKILNSVAASLFRRGFRLYLPVFIITLLTSIYIYFGFYESQRQFIISDGYFPGPWHEPKPAQMETLGEQLYLWQNEMWLLTDITNNETIFPDADQHLWSIHAEMRASVAMYGCLMAVACCKRWARLTFLLLLTFAFFLWDNWEIWIYLLSAVVAQVDIILTERGQTDELSPKAPHLLSPLSAADPEKRASHLEVELAHLQSRVSPTTKAYLNKFVRVLVFLFAGYLLSFPVSCFLYAPGYEVAKALIPEWVTRKDKIYPNLGAGLLIFLLARSDPVKSRWRRITASPLALYLGSISFSIYLVHGPVLHAFGYMIPHRIWWATGQHMQDTSSTMWCVGIFTGWFLSLIATFIAADVWKREVEDRCVRSVKWLEGVCFK